MFYKQLAYSCLVSLAAADIAFGANKEHDSKMQEIAFRHVAFEQYQDKHRAAYLAADYYQRRGVQSEAIRLAQAGASLELGYLDHGRALIANLEPTSLSPRHQSSLRLYLARDAYRRRDWRQLENELTLLTELRVESDNERNIQTYLHIESARQKQNIAEANRFLATLDKHFSLTPHALFNIAVASIHADQDNSAAIEKLQDIVDLAPRDLSELMLVDRARVALAEIYIKQEQWSNARQSLAQVSANHRHGPHALAQLARLDMQQAQYENAAAIWQYLLTHHPWHRASTHATSGLGYALQNARGDESAFLVYNEGLSRIAQQQGRLATVSARVQQELQNPDAMTGTNQSLMIWLTDELGHEDWLAWLASTQVRRIANRWQALDRAYKKLLVDREQLDALLRVDAEQQTRVARINQVAIENKISNQLTDLTTQIALPRQALLEYTETFEDDLAPFALPEQKRAMAEISGLRQRYMQLAQSAPDSVHADPTVARINRLDAMVRYAVFDQLPHEKQQQIARYDRQLAVATQAAERLNRITGAATHQRHSVGVRIKNLAATRQALEQQTRLALAQARQQLLASLDQLIKADLASLQAQLAGLQYDITRLADRRTAVRATP